MFFCAALQSDGAKRDGDKKTWIFDPESKCRISLLTRCHHRIEKRTCLLTGELCQALKCRKEERCLLENTYTAVCVSRAEIKRNG